MGLISKAVREKVKVKVLLMSPSGAGKTYSALRLAKGMGGKTLLIDTEARRGLYYADEFDYDYIELKEVVPKDEDYDEYKKILPKINEPFAPENYIALIKYAVDNDYDNLIIDSLTHEWNAKGGILNAKDKMPGYNDYTKWKTLTPRHNDFIYEILHSPINVIATVRGKDEYVLEENSKGKQVPRKVGLGAVQRDGMEYEYTVTLMLDQETHNFSAEKDNTHLFEGRNGLLTEDDGRNLILWANKGKQVTKKVKSEVKPSATTTESTKDLGEIIKEIDTIAKDMIPDKKDPNYKTVQDKLVVSIKKHHKNANYNSIKDIRVAEAVLNELKNIK
ncbi:AAA family ATPase [Clostridium sp. MT-14]|uniref:AAA family ATPase n=1 Tax=Clostridium sp. MT-14 TaxID=3348360 RepID=UPI0035F4916E